MLITIRELELKPLDFEEELPAESIDLGSEGTLVAPVQAAGRAELLEEHHGKGHVLQDLRLHGTLATRVEMACARCLEPVQRDVNREFDLLYRPERTSAKAGEVEVTGAESEISFYSGEGLELADALREQILLELPLKVLCREDCKGLCPSCGVDLNHETCSCEKPVDARWATLQELQNKLKQ
jgi:uncharacterized protein